MGIDLAHSPKMPLSARRFVRQPGAAGRIVAPLARLRQLSPGRERAPDVGELRSRARRILLTYLVTIRRGVAPVLMTGALWIAWLDPAPWRRSLLFALGGVLLALTVHDLWLARRLRDAPLPERMMALPVPNLVLIVLVQHTAIFATGGLSSPLLPLVLPTVFLVGLYASPRATSLLAALVHLPMLWLAAAVELSDAFEIVPALLTTAPPSEPGRLATWSWATVMSVAVILISVISSMIARGFEAVLGEALETRDEALHSRTEQARELTALSREIAHELKNPLASVKGLAALIERELDRAPIGAPVGAPVEHGGSSGKARERVGVLRREVDRLQSILDEFLNFSRPLAPLSLREVELREIVDHATALHEGVASEAGVRIHSKGRSRLRCDPRKVGQIVINLLQNALEVAPRGSSVALDIEPNGAQVELRVRDSGPGRDPSVRGREFEAGVTNKASGSGIGLTIARAIARQHGGELELGERSDGTPGCEARLSLPIAGLAQEQRP